MAITANDVKLVKSQVMLDVPEGGGAPSGNVILDGTSNSIFPDISELDRAAGRVNCRKVFATVQTADTDSYFGANMIVAEPPEDPRVSVTLFSTESTFDVRTGAASRIESYLSSGAEWTGYLYENHLAGQRVIQIFQRTNAALPNVGQTLVLVENENAGNQKLQYVRLTSLSSEVRTFSYSNGSNYIDYTATVVTANISDALRTDFTGSSASPSFTRTSVGTKVRDTVVADAGTYVGVVPLTEAVAVGDFTVSAESIYTQLVPSAQTEIPISFVQPYSASGLPVPGAAPVTYTAGNTWNTTTSLSLAGGCLPGSLSIQAGSISIFDDAGILRTSTGTLGTIDYANGILALDSTSIGGNKVITYTPAAFILRAPQSSEVPITAESRSQSYVGTVNPIPQPGTLSLSYMALGRWYVLSDAGNGALKGTDAAYGAGTFNKNTGAFLVTLGALPDVGSSLILTWNVPTQETQQPSTVLKASQLITLTPPSGKAVQPGSLSVAWTYIGGRTSPAATSGALSGDATGTLNIAQNELTFAPNVLPTAGTQLTVSYVAGPKQEDSFSHPARNGSGLVPVAASLGAITPGSLEVEWNTITDVSVLGTYSLDQIKEMGITPADPTNYARDDGVGNVVLSGSNIGTVNYATGAVVFNPDVILKIPRPAYVATNAGVTGRFRINYNGIEYVSAPSVYPNDLSGYVKLRYNSAGATTNETQTVTFSPSLTLVPGVSSQVVTGSIVLTGAGTYPWGDNGQGTLREFTNSGWVTRGTINYLIGEISLTSWTAGVTNAITRASCVTTVGENISSEYVFRTGAAPLRPGSLSIQYARAIGGTQTVTAGVNGLITATGISGEVDYDTGLVRVRFGTTVAAAGNESQPWYSAAQVSGGNIFRPEPVAASSMRYSAVAYSYLPLDADIIGIDPVRLPTDGRVPIFRPGGFAVVGHTGTVGPLTVANAQVVNCGRVRLSRVRVIGNNGQVITTGYTADLEAGTVTFSNVTGYSQPITVQHRIEDMALVSDAQINGDLTFTRAMTHVYPVPGSYVSSALIAGDLQSRVSVRFDQATWTSVWSDVIIGSAATGTFNSAVSPIITTNAGTVTERWALQFTNSTSFNIIGENVGVIGIGNTGTNLSPINPATAAPYFTVPAAGWGLGWSTGNVLRFNTIGAEFPVWVVRTILQGPETVTNDSFTLLIRGDVDQP